MGLHVSTSLLPLPEPGNFTPLLLTTGKMKILAMFLKKTLKNFFQGIKKPGCGLCSVGCALGSFFLRCSACSPAVAVGVWGGKKSSCVLSLSSKKCYSCNITFLSVFYHDCIKDFCKERHFSAWGDRKIVVMGKPCGGRNGGLGKRKSSRNCSGCPYVFCR